MQKLYETYEQCSKLDTLHSQEVLTPPFHVLQQAHIEIVLRKTGILVDARVIEKHDTIIPATEKSATARTRAIVPHPLCDHIKYCASDYNGSQVGGNKYFAAYHSQLKAWCESPYSHEKAKTVLSYVERGKLVRDLIEYKVLPSDEDGNLLIRWDHDEEKPPLFRQLTPENGLYKPQNALIRWIVELGDDLSPEAWKDKSLQSSWIKYCTTLESKRGFCMVSGIECSLAVKHPRGIRGGKDGAKLISYRKEDDSGYIYLGRFLAADQVTGIGVEITQKAHSALSWLIQRQAYYDRASGQVFIAWSISGNPIPDPFHNSLSLFVDAGISPSLSDTANHDVGQTHALQLRRAIQGYCAKLDPTDDIVVMGLDSATPGRMAITFYRELKGSEFLDRVETWHSQYAWPQNFGMDTRFVGVPAPRDIAEAAYGRRLDDKLRKSVVERLLPCIIDAQPLPYDLLRSVSRRVCNRAAMERWEWEKALGIACSLFKGYSSSTQQKEYQMSLEPDLTSRDYLYGRLLAVADNIESFALTKAEKNRDTSAAKLMQRFADRPFSTWKTIRLALNPYMSRLRSSEKGAGFLYSREKLLDEIMCAFSTDDFTKDAPLSAEFLLGYHCQRQKLLEKSEIPAPSDDSNDQPETP